VRCIPWRLAVTLTTHEVVIGGLGTAVWTREVTQWPEIAWNAAGKKNAKKRFFSKFWNWTFFILKCPDRVQMVWKDRGRSWGIPWGLQGVLGACGRFRPLPATYIGREGSKAYFFVKIWSKFPIWASHFYWVHDTRPIAFQNNSLDPLGHFEYTHVVDLTYIASCERQTKKWWF